MQAYDKDIVAWANEQARLLRAGRFDLLDIEHIAEEIEDVGKSEQRELASRMALLLAHLLKWQHQPAFRNASWKRTMTEQRKELNRRLAKNPGLQPMLTTHACRRRLEKRNMGGCSGSGWAGNRAR